MEENNNNTTTVVNATEMNTQQENGHQPVDFYNLETNMLDIHSNGLYQQLLRHTYEAIFEQNERFHVAQISTRGDTLTNFTDERNPYKTIITEQKLCGIPTVMRKENNKQPKVPPCKKRKFVDTSNKRMDFLSAIDQQSEENLQEYEGLYLAEALVEKVRIKRYASGRKIQ